MNPFTKRVAAVVLAASLTVAANPLIAAPRDERGDVPRIVKVIKKLQKLLGISTHDEQPVPPRP